MFFCSTGKKKYKNHPSLSAVEDNADSPAALHKTSPVSSRSSTSGVLTGTGHLSTAEFFIRIRCALQRRSPPHPYFPQLGLHPSAVPAHNTNLEDNIQEQKLHGTNRHSVHRPGQAPPAARNMQRGGDGQPAQSLPQTGPGCLASQALHGVSVAASGLQLAWICTSHCPQDISSPHVCCWYQTRRSCGLPQG